MTKLQAYKSAKSAALFALGAKSPVLFGPSAESLALFDPEAVKAIQDTQYLSFVLHVKGYGVPANPEPFVTKAT